MPLLKLPLLTSNSTTRLFFGTRGLGGVNCSVQYRKPFYGTIAMDGGDPMFIMDVIGLLLETSICGKLDYEKDCIRTDGFFSRTPIEQTLAKQVLLPRLLPHLKSAGKAEPHQILLNRHKPILHISLPKALVQIHQFANSLDGFASWHSLKGDHADWPVACRTVILPRLTAQGSQKRKSSWTESIVQATHRTPHQTDRH